MNAGSWQPQPQPQPQPGNHSPRDDAVYTADADEFHAAEILAIATSALNLLLAAVL